jgi:hypothetical protein
VIVYAVDVRRSSQNRGSKCVLIAIFVGVATLACTRPPLRVHRVGDQFIVDVQTLGEYPTTVTSIRLRRGDEVVWDVKAREKVQIHTFRLRVGSNPSVPVACGGGPPPACDHPEPLDGYVATRPESGSFAIERGSRYRLDVWGSSSGSWWSKASASIDP